MLIPGLVAFTLCSWLAVAEPTTNDFTKTKRSEPITFLLKRREVTWSPQDMLRADLARMRRLFGPSYSEENVKRKASSSITIPLGNLREDVMYYSTIQMGTPPQHIDVQIDTASSDLWVYTNDCPSCKPTSPLPQSDGTVQYFNKSRSSTLSISNTPVGITYAGGDGVAGVIATDVVSVGGFSVPEQSFIYVESQQGTRGGPGIMGFGWSPNAVTNATPWWLNAIDQFETPEFSLLFTQWNGTTTNPTAPGGQFTLGGRNASVYDGNITFLPITSDKYWDVPFTGINVSPSHNVTIGNDTNAIIDSGTTLLYGPEQYITEFYAGVEGALRGETVNNQTLSGLWLIPCKNAVNAEFILGNVSVILPAAALHLPATKFSTYVLPQGGQNTTYCIGGLASTEFSKAPYWVWGDVFLKGLYTVFRKGIEGEPPSIGFAKLKGVDYAGNGTSILGFNGNGIDGSIGNTGPNGTVIMGEPTTSTSGPVYTTVARKVSGWNP